jgi:hypothetical protein
MLAMGKNRDEIKEALAKELKDALAGKIGADKAEGVAGQMSADAVRAMEEDMAAKLFGEPGRGGAGGQGGGREQRQSEVLNAADIGQRVQQGVSNGPDKQLDALKEIRQEVAKANELLVAWKRFQPQTG